jgi:hypothetical protein
VVADGIEHGVHQGERLIVPILAVVGDSYRSRRFSNHASVQFASPASLSRRR